MIINLLGFPDMASILRPQKVGKAEIKYYEVHDHDFRAIFHDGMIPGETYAQLFVGGQLMMSDTPMERESNQEILEKAHGHVLIGGLGLGMVLLALQEKPEVERITIVETNPDVLKLICDQLTGYFSNKVQVVQDDAFTFSGYGWKFNTIYMDIWPDYGEHLKSQMNVLREKYVPMLDINDQEAWFGCWQENVAFSQEDEEAEEYYFGKE